MPKIVSSSVRPRGASLFQRTHTLADKNHAATTRLVSDLRQRIARSVVPTPAAQERLIQQLIFEVLGADPFPAQVRSAFSNAVARIVRDELAPLYVIPAVPPANDPLAGHELRVAMTHRIAYFDHEAEYLAVWRQQLCAILRTIARAYPRRRPTAAGLTFSMPLLTLLPDPIGTIDDITRQLSKFAPDPTDPTIRPGTRLAGTIIANVLAASRVTFEDAQKRPYRLTWPAEAKAPAAELVSSYLGDTPLAALLNVPVEVAIPSHLRTEHAIITATIGHGKTQLMQSVIMRDLDDPARPGILCMDSQGDAINTCSRISRLADRLILIDPTDDHPPALNLFHWDREFAATLTQNQREEYLAGVVEMFNFIAGGLLGSELTARMSVVFRFISQLLIEIPNASIHTLIQLLQDPAPFMQHIAVLPPTAQTFIDELFSDRSQFRQTRQHLLQRLYHIISNPAFERMFAHHQNKFDMRAALNEGKVILINTAKAQLKAEWSSIFGRFFVAQIMQAAFARAFIPREQRRLALIHIDECHEYLDDNISALMLQGRKYAIALHLYHQHFSQMTDAGLKQTALSIPALRFTGSLSDTDATLLAKEMKTSPEFLKAVGKTDRGAEWSLYVRNLTPTATRIFVPFLSAENEPKMSEAAYQQLLARNRALVGAPRRPHSSPPTPTTPIGNDGDSY